MKRIISVLLVVCVMLTLSVTSFYAGDLVAVENNPAIYQAKFEDRLASMCGESARENYGYSEMFYYYSEQNTSDIPDWALAFGVYAEGSMYTYGVFDDCYYIQRYSWCEPFALGYVIYVPAEDRFYALEDAWEKKIEGIEKAFTEGLIPLGVAGVIGDADKDGGLSILDATQIQLEVASLSERKDVEIGGLLAYGEEMKYITDLDRDGEITVMDATEIQRKLARIE